MQRQPIRSIALHALAVVVITLGLAAAAAPIVVLTIEAQPIDIAVGAALRALWAYVQVLGALAAAIVIGAVSAAACASVIDSARRARVGR